MKAICLIRSLCVLVVLEAVVACQGQAANVEASQTASPTAPSTPTATASANPTETRTATPTFTLVPTNTPNASMTEQYSDMTTSVNRLYEDGFIPSKVGTYLPLNDFSGTWAEISWYSWSYTKYAPKDFVIKVHMAWQSASKTPNESGCGIVFHEQPNQEHYVVFVMSNGMIQFGITTDQFHDQGYHYYGKPANEGEVDFSMVSLGSKVTIFINDTYIYSYTSLLGKMTDGKLAYATLSGTNAGYGTRCNITQAVLWEINP